MVTDRVTRPFGIEASDQNGNGHEKKESDGGKDTMAENQAVVLCEGRKAVSHACCHNWY